MSWITTDTIAVNAIFQDELKLWEECSKRVDGVEATIEKHLNEFKPVCNAKRWKNNKNKTIFIIEYMVYFN